MQTSQPATSPLGIILLVVAIHLLVRSPKRLQTGGRMVAAFVGALLLCIVPSAVLRVGDPEAWGRIAGLVGLLIAVIAGWWHIRSIKIANIETSAQPSSKS